MPRKRQKRKQPRKKNTSPTQPKAEAVESGDAVVLEIKTKIPQLDVSPIQHVAPVEAQQASHLFTQDPLQRKVYEHVSQPESDSESDWESLEEDDDFFMPRTKADKNVGNYVITKKLERGGFGTVFRAEIRRDTKGPPAKRPKRSRKKVRPAKPVAIKVYSLDCDEIISKEAQIMKRVRHTNILQTTGPQTFISKANRLSYQYVCMQLYPKDLTALLYEQRRKTNCFSPQTTYKVMKQIVAGLNALHQKFFVHGDLKPENVLVDDTGPEIRVCLCDFGSAYDLQQREHDRFGHTLALMSAEMITNTASLIGTPADIFGLACLYVEVVTQQNVFAAEKDENLHLALIKKMNGGQQFPDDMLESRKYFTVYGRVHENAERRVAHWAPWHTCLDLTESQITLVEKCCRVQPQERPTLHDFAQWLDNFYAERKKDVEHVQAVKVAEPIEVPLEIK
ncbi:protein kinase [bacterium]|nr:protein kinase [bacterium]